MALLTIEQARSQCRVVGTYDDDDLETYIAAAGAAAAAYLNRSIFEDQQALDAALDGAPGESAQAAQDYADAIEAAKAVPNEHQRAAMIQVAERRLSDAERQFRHTLNGIVANPAILAAVRMHLTDLYDVRGSVVIGTSVAELSDNAKALLRPYRLVMMP